MTVQNRQRVVTLRDIEDELQQLLQDDKAMSVERQEMIALLVAVKQARAMEFTAASLRNIEESLKSR